MYWVSKKWYCAFLITLILWRDHLWEFEFDDVDGQNLYAVFSKFSTSVICLFSPFLLSSFCRLLGLWAIWLQFSASSQHASPACGSSSCFSTPAHKLGRMTHQPSPSSRALCLFSFSHIAGSRDALQLIHSLIRLYYCAGSFTICKMPLEPTVVGCKSLAQTAMNWIFVGGAGLVTSVTQ